MTIYRVKIITSCQFQISNIYNVLKYELLSPYAANRFKAGLDNLISSLEKFPYRFPVMRNNEGRFEIRHVCFVMNYVAFYIIDENDQLVKIVGIKYGKQNTTAESLMKFEDRLDIEAYKEARKKFKKNPRTYSHEDMKRILRSS